MSVETIHSAIDWALSQPEAGQGLGLGLFGGEPFLVRRSVVEAVQYATRRTRQLGLPVAFATSTNATLVTQSDAHFLAHHKVLVQVSVDGVPTAHDMHRSLAPGQPSSGAVLRNLDTLRKAGVSVETATVVTPKTAHMLPESFRFLARHLGIRAMHIALSLAETWTEQDRNVLAVAMSEVAAEVTDLYRDGVICVVDMFDEKIESWINNGYVDHQYCPMGKGKISIDIDGTIYPCDRIAGDGSRSHLSVGTIFSGLDVQKVNEFRQLAGSEKRVCDSCPVAGRCRHWCGCMNVDATGTLNQVSDLFCFFERLRVQLADQIAETLFDEKNPAFLARFYKGIQV